MRKGIAGLAALTQDVLRQKPDGGARLAFRGRGENRLNASYWDGQGFASYYNSPGTASASLGPAYDGGAAV